MHPDDDDDVLQICRSYARESDEGPAGFATEEAAFEYIRAFRDASDERTLATAVAEYLEHRRAIGKREGTVTTDGYLRLSITYQSGMADDGRWCEV